MWGGGEVRWERDFEGRPRWCGGGRDVPHDPLLSAAPVNSHHTHPSHSPLTYLSGSDMVPHTPSLHHSRPHPLPPPLTPTPPPSTSHAHTRPVRLTPTSVSLCISQGVISLLFQGAISLHVISDKTQIPHTGAPGQSWEAVL